MPFPPLAAGPFNPTWESLDAYECPEWFRDAKFGVPFGRVGRALMAHFYNRSLEWNDGRLEAVYTIKGHGPDHGEYREGIAVQDLERRVLDGIKPQPWQSDSSVADGFYSTRYLHKSTADVIHLLVDIVSKNGNLLLNFTQRPDGTLDPQTEQILAEAEWMPINGEAIFDTQLFCAIRPTFSTSPAHSNPDKTASRFASEISR